MTAMVHLKPACEPSGMVLASFTAPPLPCCAGVEQLAMDVQAWLMMAKVHRGNGDMDGYDKAQVR